jgi:hypothetical protein
MMDVINDPGCRRVDVLKDASSNMDIVRSPAWKRRSSPRTIKTNDRIRQAEWPMRRSPRALQSKIARHQGEMKLSRDIYIEMMPRDALRSA